MFYLCPRCGTVPFASFPRTEGASKGLAAHLGPFHQSLDAAGGAVTFQKLRAAGESQPARLFEAPPDSATVHKIFVDTTFAQQWIVQYDRPQRLWLRNYFGTGTCSVQVGPTRLVSFSRWSWCPGEKLRTCMWRHERAQRNLSVPSDAGARQLIMFAPAMALVIRR
jgi:hypothetical protein